VAGSRARGEGDGTRVALRRAMSLPKNVPARSRRPADPLKPYREKRDFAVTREPRGRAVKRAAPPGLSFVVQKHAARRLHYDLRLEHDGVLWSWAVPKGPSLDPKQRRLAARTEDHPLEYASFEGVIPDGEYGAGPVIVWDRGTWSPEDDATAAMEKGHLSFTLEGEKLHGRFHLVRLKPDTKGKENWLLFKSKDDAAQPGEIVTERPDSVASGRTIEDVSAKPKRVWRSNRSSRPRETRAARRATAARQHADVASALRALPLGFSLTNLEKMLYPDAGVRKLHLLAYYASIAEILLPHTSGRPLSLVRCPGGASAKCFYQKHATEGFPEVVGRVSIVEGGRPQPYMMIEDLAGLVALGQMGVLEIHSWMCHADDVEKPDEIVLDIDPDTDLPFAEVVETAQLLHAKLDALGLTSFVKTTGGKGLHVALPVGRRLDWETHKEFARALVTQVAEEHPGRFVTTVRKDRRKGKLFLDYLRNGRGATAVVPYSPRARPGAPVATPLAWDELTPSLDPKRFTLATVLERVASRPDPWSGFASVRQSITKKALAAVGA
jgi:bifunctional non-homologous end joining protein LigD